LDFDFTDIPLSFSSLAEVGEEGRSSVKVLKAKLRHSFSQDLLDCELTMNPALEEMA
jgi:hypothetical protein